MSLFSDCDVRSVPVNDFKSFFIVASPKIWRETCESYSKILANEGSVYKAVTYLLAAKMVKEAISMLVSHKLFK